MHTSAEPSIASTALYPAVSRLRRSDGAPLSFAQEGLWFRHQLDVDRWDDNELLVLDLEGSLDAPALEASLNEIVRRHDVLRTRFAAVDGGPVQIVEPFPPIRLAPIDVPGDDAYRRLLAEERRRPFRLEEGPLMRPLLVRLGPHRHALAIAVHHIACDAISSGILMRELASLYGAAAAGQPSPMAPLTVQYADYAAWERGWLRDEALEAALDRAAARLAGVGPALLPCARATRTPQDVPAVGLWEETILPSNLVVALRRLCQRERSTFSTALLASLQALLHAYTEQRDLLIGVMFANRSRPGLDALIGFFHNTLLVRTWIAEGDTFRTLLQRTARQALDAFADPYVPFDRIVRRLNPARDPSRDALVQVAWTFAHSACERLELPGLTIARSRPLAHGAALFDLECQVLDGLDRTRLRLVYRQGLFDRDRIARLCDHWLMLLQGIVADPDRRLSEVSLLTAGERRALLPASARTIANKPADVAAHARFEMQASRTPDAIAVAGDGLHVSYAVLDRHSAALARRLRTLCPVPEAPVATCVDRGVSLLVALLGTLKAGAAYLPLDPAYPVERLRTVIADAGARVLLTDRRARNRCPATAREVIDLDLPDSFAKDAGRDAAHVAGGSECALGALAYCIYTSGSTGSPKGVLIEHRGLVNHLQAKIEDLQLTGEDVVALAASPGFDVSIWQMLAVLLVGGRVEVVDDETSADPSRLLRALDRGCVTIFETVPAVLGLLLEEPDLPHRTLRVLICNAEPLPASMCRRWQERCPATLLVNAYGPTECSDDVMHLHLQRALAPHWRHAPLGHVLRKLQVYVLNRSLLLLPPDVAGELCIGGAGVGRGYLGRPDLTAERFVPDAFGPRPGARLYRTGDRVRRHADGAIEFLERLDSQIKIRGHRIELGEIEAVLAQHPGVRHCAVAVSRDEAGDARLVAYIAAPDDMDVGALRGAASVRLPAYMVPSAWVRLDALPLTPNGKVDRRALPAPQHTDAGRDASRTEPPRGPVEDIVAGIWAEVLRVPRIGRLDHFFDLGGHSLIATQIVARVRQAFGMELPLRLLFERPILADFAAAVFAARREGSSLALPPVLPRTQTTDIPVSFAQQRLWFVEHLSPGGAVYNVPAAVRLGGALDVVALRRTLTEIVRRHEVLRTTLPEIDGEPRQAIQAPAPVPVPVVDLAAHSHANRMVERLARREADRPFDLARGPLMRVHLLRVAREDHVLLITLHHIVCDGWSVAVLLREITAGYDAYHRRAPFPLAPLPVQYADVAIWQRDLLAREAMTAQLDYWRATLAGVEPLALPGDLPPPPLPSHRGARARTILPPDVAEGVTRWSRREGVTVFMTLLAAFQILLSRYTRQRDIAVGTDVANRTQTETEALIGFFVNQLVLRSRVDGAASLRAFVHAVRDVTLEAYAHQELPFERVVDALAPERVLGRMPLFQVKLVLQNVPQEAAHLPGLEIRPLALASLYSKLDLTLLVSERGDGLWIEAEYATERFSAVFVERLLAQYARLLVETVERPDQVIDAVDLLGADERRQILVDWNQAPVSPALRSVNDRFLAHVSQRPDAVALVHGEQHVSYDALHARASRLAHSLRNLAVGPETRVGLCTERGVDQIVGLIGILLAGAAYVPLDPNVPPSRLAWMMEDAGVPVVLTQSHVRDRLPITWAQVMCVDETADSMDAARAATPPPCSPHPDTLAYVIYTSGSTGQPKATMISHHGLAHSTASRYTFYAERPAAYLIIPSITFDSSVVGIFHTLTSGGTLVLLNEGAPRDPEALCETIARAGVTHLLCVPSLYSAILDAAATDRLASLEVAIVAGEALVSETAAMHFRVAPHAALYNEYGPTEATVWSTAARCTPADNADVSIGRAVPHAQVYVVDAAGHAAPIGIPGELWIGGAGVSRGYLNRPDLTADRFVPDPFGGVGARLYRSGDRARWRAHGTLEFLGRADDQVKLRGYRIEPGEIEAALREHSAVRDCVVLLRDERLTAYVVASPSVESDALRSHLANKLPEYMVPTVWVVLDALPRSPNGKVDRRALPAPDAPPVRSSYVAPRTPTERHLTEIWAQVLRAPRVGIHDNFFELGADSILSVRVAARANRLGLPLKVPHLFQHQTIAELAPVLEALSSNSALAAGAEDETPGTPTLTPIQRWFFEQPWPRPWYYNQAVLLVPRHRVRPAGLRAAIRAIVRHHEALRSRFECVDGTWSPHADNSRHALDVFSAIDLRQVAPPVATHVLERACALLQGSLSLADGPLIRVAHFRLPNDESRLLVVVHHLAVDAVSWRILLDDLGSGYQQWTMGQPVDLGPGTLPYRRWAQRLASNATLEMAAPDAEYWLSLDTADLPSLPRDVIATTNRRASQRVHRCLLDPAETQMLREHVHPRWQMPEVLLAALGDALAAWNGRRDLLIDIEGHGREPIGGDTDTTRTVGWFTTIHPLRLPREPGLAAVSAAYRGVPRRGLGYALLRTFGDEATASRLRALPGAEVSFNYLGQMDEMIGDQALFDFAPESAGATDDPHGFQPYLLQIDAGILHGCLTASFTYSEQIHHAPTIERLATAFTGALRAMATAAVSPSEQPSAAEHPGDLADVGLTADDVSRFFDTLAQHGYGRP